MANGVPGKIEFLCHLGHEMKTVVASLSGALEILKGRYQDKAGSTEKALFDISEKNAARLAKLAGSLLDFAHRQTGGLPPIAPRRVVLKNSLNASLALLKYAFRERDMSSLEISFPKGLAVRADPEQLVQVFTNLIENAVKFTPPGRKIGVFAREEKLTHSTPRAEARDTLRVDTERRFSLDSARGLAPSNVSNVLVCVWDEGIGISARDRQKIFERFYRAAPDKSSGSGIGLSVVKWIIEQHGGKIWVESKAGKGSRFYFTLTGVKNGG